MIIHNRFLNGEVPLFTEAWKSIKKRKFSPVYLLYGEEQFLIEETKNLIVEHALESEEREFGLSVYDLEETAVDVAIEDCETIPFFGGNKVVIMKNPYFLTAEKGKEKVEHNLSTFLEYLNQPSPSTVAVIIAPYEKLDERKKVTKELKKKAEVLHAKKMTEHDTINWIKHRFESAGYNITNGAAENLQLLVGFNLTQLNMEIEKLKLYSMEDKTIDEDKVALLVSRSLEDNVFHLVDQVVQRNLKGVLETYRDLLKRNEEPIKILAVVASHLRLLFQVKALLKKGYSQAQIAKQLKIHPYRVKLAAAKSGNFDEQWLLNCLEQLSELDYQMKTGFGNREKMLELFFIRVLV